MSATATATSAHRAAPDGPAASPAPALPAWLGPAATAGAALCACAADTVLNPYRGQTPECPFHAVTGLYCPFCGSARMLHSALRGHLGAALAANPLTLLALPVLIWAWAGWMTQAVGGPRLWRPTASRRAVLVLVAAVVAFGVARNVPWAPLHVLGP